MLISIVSGKGGTGKTVISACISVCLAKQGKKIVVVDANSVFSDLDIVLGVEGEFTYNVFDVLSKKCNLYDSLHKVCEDNELYFLPSSRQNDIFNFNIIEFKNLLDELKNKFDYVVVDCANNNVIIQKLMSVSDMAIVITCPDLLSVRNSDSLISLIEDENIDIKLLINKFISDETSAKYCMTPDEILSELGVKLIGIIPECDEFIKLINLSALDLFKSETGLSCVFENITKRIMGESVPLTQFNKKVKQSKLKFLNKK